MVCFGILLDSALDFTPQVINPDSMSLMQNSKINSFAHLSKPFCSKWVRHKIRAIIRLILETNKLNHHSYLLAVIRLRYCNLDVGKHPNVSEKLLVFGEQEKQPHVVISGNK